MANKYTGEKCIACGEPFKEGDEVVVCPDCGTPYHKGCWPEDNECLNRSLHESGGSWTPAPKPRYAAPGEGVRCIRCGTENPAGQRFCGECGMPLDVSRNGERPFNNMPAGYGAPQNSDTDRPEGTPGGGFPDIQQIKLTAQSDLDGIKLGDFFDYIGTRSITLITNFVKFAKTGGKLSINIAAFFIPEFYFFYRRMTKQGIFMLLISFLLDIPLLIFYGQTGTLGQVFFTTNIDVRSVGFESLLQMCSLADLSVQIISALFANYWYYLKARRDIAEIRAVDGEKEPEIKTKEKIRGAGGTSWAAVVGAFAGQLILTLGFMLFMTYMF